MQQPIYEFIRIGKKRHFDNPLKLYALHRGSETAVLRLSNIEVLCIHTRPQGATHALTPYIVATHQEFGKIWDELFVPQFKPQPPRPNAFVIRCDLNGLMKTDADHAPLLFDKHYQLMTDVTNMAMAKKQLAMAYKINGDIAVYASDSIGGCGLHFILCRAAIMKTWNEMDPTDYKSDSGSMRDDAVLIPPPRASI